MDILRSAYNYYNSINYAEPDPRTRHWFLLNDSPTQVHILSLAYLLFVFFGSKIMKNKKPFELKAIMVVYNLSLVLLSFYMLVEIVLCAVELRYGVSCAVYNKQTSQNPKEMRLANVLWWYFFSKAIELCDTVLMILRKKNNQVTFLHVFHHVSMLNIWWRVMTYIPGGLSYFGSCLNCAVHVVMYTYYGLSVIPSARKHLWWKKYLTMFQLIQFVITFTHTCSTVFVGCDFPAWGQSLMFWYMIIMMILFSNFYLHAYILKRNKFDPNNFSRQSALLTDANQANLARPPLHTVQGDGFTNGQKFSNGFSNKKSK